MSPKCKLANPISEIVDKPRDQFTREDMLTVIQRRQIQWITFHYSALDGKLKELKLPIADLKQAERILSDGERVDGSSLFKGLVDVAVSDLYVVPVYKTAFLNPFDDGSLDFICRYLRPDGSLAPFTLDNTLLKAQQLLQKHHGLSLNALGELEFFLLRDPDVAIYQSQRQCGYHASGPFAKTGQILNEMLYHITRITGAVKYGHNEVGYVDAVRSDLGEIKGKRAEQLEVEFLPTPVDEMGDHLVLARWLIRNIAFKYGCVATFTPKLEEGVAGNGLHVHTQLVEAQTGHSVMTDKSGKLSEQARKLIGGLCCYADSLTAFGNTVSGAYLRLVPNQEAPTRICWSDMNRSAMIRVPLGWSTVADLAKKINPQQKSSYEAAENRQTVELRSPDGSAIVQLLLAGIVMAADHGLSDPGSLELAERLYVTGNIFKDREVLAKLPVLPGSCVESSRRLVEKRELYEREGVFQPSVIDYVARLLDAQADEHMNRRLGDLPADDRLHETRKIMHRDIHTH
ncbi:MAG: glutamine synthetase [Candidatus Riflebacteria bacterium]|nr:glutamine synthetase [Candidatus Riflebacteria bacterium]